MAKQVIECANVGIKLVGSTMQYKTFPHTPTGLETLLGLWNSCKILCESTFIELSNVGVILTRKSRRCNPNGAGALMVYCFLSILCCE